VPLELKVDQDEDPVEKTLIRLDVRKEHAGRTCCIYLRGDERTKDGTMRRVRRRMIRFMVFTSITGY
jgi:hypothetical protein